MNTKRSSVLRGLIAALLAAAGPTAVAAVTPGSENLVTGTALLREIEALHSSLSMITDLLASANVPDDSEVMTRTAKLVRRVRSLLYATSEYQIANMPEEERRLVTDIVDDPELAGRREWARRAVENRQRLTGERVLTRKEKRAMLRGHTLEEVQIMQAAARARAEEENEMERRLVEPEPEVEEYGDDMLMRDLYEETITFPECVELLLDDCLALINTELIELQRECDIIIHEKRNPDQDNYNKVVIITDMTATITMGKDGNGQVTYPFMWDEVVGGVSVGERRLGIEGAFDCYQRAPEDCCEYVKTMAPHPDVNGKMIECHIFVPFGGVGNEKRDDRVFVNLSPDGRVHEPPIIQ